MSKWIKRILLIAIAAVVFGGLIYALRPLPVPVDTAELGTGPLEVTVDEEGVTRIREVYMVSAPIAGKASKKIKQTPTHEMYHSDFTGPEHLFPYVQLPLTP